MLVETVQWVVSSKVGVVRGLIVQRAIVLGGNYLEVNFQITCFIKSRPYFFVVAEFFICSLPYDS